MFYTLGLPVTKSASLEFILESIISQTFFDFEVIIHNNAADNYEKIKIREVVNGYLNDRRLSYFENESTIPVYDNYNAILTEAKGEYFCIIKELDILDKRYLEIFYTLILKYKHCYIFHCRVKIVDQDGKLLEVSPICPEFEMQADFIYHKVWQKRIQFVSDFVVTTEQLKNIGGFDKFQLVNGLEDLVWDKLAVNGIAYTPYPALVYKSIPLVLGTTKEAIKVRFDDINKFLSGIKKIVFDRDFDNSLYLISHFDYKINAQETLLYRHVFEEYVSQLPTVDMMIFYLKNRGKYPLRMSYLYYALKARITKNRWVGDY